MTNKFRVAIYCRVSTDEQDATTQERMCREYCARMGYDVFKVYTDAGVSGTRQSRPAFDELLTDMRLYRFNCVMVTKLDRMGRSLQHILSLFEEFKSKGIQFCATTQQIDTSTAAGKMHMQTIGMFSEYERNLISERTKDGIRGKPNVGKRGPDKKPRLKRGVLRKAVGWH
jgi:DNA invertase Pin-like site-specific DNA recombinase